MTWEEVCNDRSLQDLPYKIELNKWGNIEMSPIKARHGEFQFWIGHLLQQQRPDGICSTEVAVETAENTKVPDLIWASFAHRRATPHEFAYAIAPEICVEVISPSNYLEEQMHKGELYLQEGAREFWLCNELGDMRFFDAAGRWNIPGCAPSFRRGSKFLNRVFVSFPSYFRCVSVPAGADA